MRFEQGSTEVRVQGLGVYDSRLLWGLGIRVQGFGFEFGVCVDSSLCFRVFKVLGCYEVCCPSKLPYRIHTPSKKILKPRTLNRMASSPNLAWKPCRRVENDSSLHREPILGFHVNQGRNVSGFDSFFFFFREKLR